MFLGELTTHRSLRQKNMVQIRSLIDHLRSKRKSWDKFFEKLGHSKAPVYAGEFRKPCTCSNKLHAQKIPEKTVSFYFVPIPRLNASLSVGVLQQKVNL